MTMRKLRKDERGAIPTWAIVTFVLALVLVLAVFSGILSFSLPTATDKYEETVSRDTTDLGMIIPLNVRLTFTQVADTGTTKTTISPNIQHKHEDLGSDDNYVPDETLITSSNFNTKVGNVNDNASFWSTNGNSFLSSNVLFNSTLSDLASVQYGYGQSNYKVWTKSSTYTPSLTEDNSAIPLQVHFKFYKKGTSELLDADIVNILVYYKIPTYNEDDSYTASYTYNVYVPFDDYAEQQDLKMDVYGYDDNCILEYSTITAITHSTWSYSMLNKFFPSASTSMTMVQSQDSVISTAMQYSWTGPTAISKDNGEQYGSHSYTYKIR